MKMLLRALILFVLVLALIVPIFAQEVTPEAVSPSPTLEVVEGAEPVVLAPVADGTGYDWVSPDVMLIAGTILLSVAMSGFFLLIVKALDALKVSVPQETMQVFGESLLTLLVRAREQAAKAADKTDTPIDNLFVELSNYPLDVLQAEIAKRSGLAAVEGGAPVLPATPA